MTIREIRSRANMTLKEFAEYFNIPQRTLENWETEKRTPPAYVVELIKYKAERERLGMLKLIEKDHGEAKVLKEGALAEIVTWLKENYDIFDWIFENDPEYDTSKLPSLGDIEILRELEYELNKMSFGWWTLEVEEV